LVETVASPLPPSEPPAPGRLFCFGLGFSARALADRLAAAGWAVAGTTRSPEKAAELRAAGLEAVLFDRGRPLDPAVLAGTTHLLVSIAPDQDGDPVLDRHAADIAALPGLKWIGYLSTTGVYGDWQGAEVDETAELRGAKGRNKRRIEAEAAWLALHADKGLPVHVFRLAGADREDRLFERLARLVDQRRVGGDAVEDPELRDRADLIDDSGIEEEFHAASRVIIAV
jgi:nucleoside-diphosphate-sugar epimerase